MLDMCGFIQLVDWFSGKEVIVVLNVYFDGVFIVVLNYGGDILKFMGDGILVVFNQ